MSYFEIPKLTRSVWKIWLRNKDVFMKTYKVNFIPPFLQPVLYLLALGFGVGAFVDEIDGMSYPRFIAPALIAISIMNTSFFECTFASYVRMYYQKTFDAIIATPISIEEVIAGELLWGATRSTINTVIILPVLAAFGVIEFPSSLLVIPFSFIAGLLFATIGMCFTAISPNIDSLNYPTFLFITPMFLFSGTFFPLSLLPVSLQYFAIAALPLTHVVIIVRSLTFADPSGFIPVSLAWIILFSLIFFILSINLMKKRLIV
ncbi:putative permease [Candidatus Methanoperedens nitroreducens]|uniref:Putative permease n=1 Tax=Candidatus Methanoperedens nitratireducens TaxID=1392998 RepID=A0A062V814_9EURY|nr:ABC transporter permease [Candidatus Methanoperedens nitroreducens]KCZ72723.1 putative permease [Candidatus Methanoperedens nitroreducens]MDJ1423344.1 ABC transporter permease [Candidatus Methanoperedens sp.]